MCNEESGHSEFDTHQIYWVVQKVLRKETFLRKPLRQIKRQSKIRDFHSHRIKQQITDLTSFVLRHSRTGTKRNEERVKNYY